ncbi:MAG: thiamine diphosphokinase [Neomegalonema sp.]|nr:thiamine diphosphokinase [Neomegalonema sp.]
MPSLSAPLSYDRPVALIGGGEAAQRDIDAALARTGATIAADGGADHFTPGQSPRLDAVIGDMDSVRDLQSWRRAEGCRVLPIQEQDTTDLEKCLYSIEAPAFLGVGFFGARLDHTLAALNLLAKRPDKRLILIGTEDVCFLTPLRWRAQLRPNARVSIVPLPSVTAIASTGLRWPLDGLTFDIGGAIGTSNQATDGAITVEFASRSAAVFFEREYLDAAIDCVIGADSAREA